MLENLRHSFESDEIYDLDNSKHDDLEVACCVLLLETAFADCCYPESEQELVHEALVRHFGLSREKAHKVTLLACAARFHQEKLTKFV